MCIFAKLLGVHEEDEAQKTADYIYSEIMKVQRRLKGCLQKFKLGWEAIFTNFQ